MGKPPTPSVDVYSFAVVLLEVYTRTPAWNGFSYADVTAAIKQGSYPSIPGDKEPDVFFYNLIVFIVKYNIYIHTEKKNYI